MQHHFRIWLGVVLVLVACKQEDTFRPGTPADENEQTWLIPEHRVFDGGPGRDGIPAIDQPQFASIEVMKDSFPEEELVVGIRIGDQVRAYPHSILDWHEIVNDEMGGEAIALTYCPLTGTALCWDRHLPLGVTTFGVSGLIFNTNLIPYDRETGSNWSQLLTKSVNGHYKGADIPMFAVVETTWKHWKEMFPDSEVLTHDTGFDRPYGEYPYGDYLTADTRLYFPIVPLDQRLPLKERVHALRVNEQVKVYRMESFAEPQVIEDTFEEEPVVLYGDASGEMIVSYSRRLRDGTELSFEVLPKDQFPAVMQDQEGNEWDVFGYALAGPRQGQQLSFLPSLMGYWLGFSSFYPDPEVY